jgi:hypothetical protein
MSSTGQVSSQVSSAEKRKESCMACCVAFKFGSDPIPAGECEPITDDIYGEDAP